MIKIMPLMQNAVPVRHSNVEPIAFSHLRTAQLIVPAGVKAQTLKVFAAPLVSAVEHGPLLPLVDASGSPVTIAVQPGSIVALPDSVCGCMFVALQAEPGKDFNAAIVAKSE